MRRKVWILPHSHYDAEVFMVEKETLETGYANIIGALALLRARPEFKFTLDQTCLIEPFLSAYPEERAFFQQMIAEGRLEIVGGMYIMPDVNIPSGESFIRQVLVARRYCERELGVDVRCGWTIDTFGHHPQIPQLMLKCGFDHNTFQRLMKRGSPSEFYWQGLDGSRLFCHWMPASYAAFSFAPGNLPEFRQFAAQRFQRLEEHAVTAHLIAPAGADLMPVEPQLVEMVRAYNRSQEEYELVFATPAEVFAVLKECDGIPTITGDLNPVFQGCYSARIDIKQWNRKLENRLVEAEIFAALARRLGAPAQAERLERAWRGVLFNQFHDIICGSHIDPVFEHTMDRFKVSQAAAEDSLAESLQAIAGKIDLQAPGPSAGKSIPLVVFNSLGWERSDVVECDVAFSEPGALALAVCDSSGRQSPCDLLRAERYPDGSLKRARILFIAHQVPACGYAVYRVVPAEEQKAAEEIRTSHPLGGLLRFELDQGWMENEFYRLEFDLWTGLITSLVLKDGAWEVLDGDRRMGNAIVKEQDSGNFWQYNGPCKGDAFYPMEGRYPLPDFQSNQADFAHAYLGDGNIRQGNVMAEFNISHPYGSGQFATRVRLYAGLPRIDIRTTLVNNDERVRYRAAFPTGIRDGKITYEIPFGTIERPEGEYPAQNWIDYSGDEYGITLLNQGLPGNNVVDGVMLLSLMKCTALEGGYGDMKLGPVTVQGFEKGKTHVFDYALVPHKGGWQEAAAYRRGAEFNRPLIVWKPGGRPGMVNGSLPEKLSFLKISGETIVLSAVKETPHGMIVRFYEAAGKRVEDASLETAWPVSAAYWTNLIEKDEQPIPLGGETRRIPFAIRPFEIKTIRLVF